MILWFNLNKRDVISLGAHAFVFMSKIGPSEETDTQITAFRSIPK